MTRIRALTRWIYTHPIQSVIRLIAAVCIGILVVISVHGGGRGHPPPGHNPDGSLIITSTKQRETKPPFSSGSAGEPTPSPSTAGSGTSGPRVTP